MKIIDHQLIVEISKMAKKSVEKKVHYPLPSTDKSNLYRALIGFEPGAFVQPHKHPSNVFSELLFLVQGECLLITFHENGSVRDGILLSTDNNIVGVDVDPTVYHTLLPLKVSTVLLEVKEFSSPVSSDEKIVAAWTPASIDQAEIKAWQEKLLKHFNIIFPEIY